MKNLLAVLLSIVLISCDSGQESKSHEEIQQEIVANQKKFAEERARIEQENMAREKQLIKQRSYVSAKFVSVDGERIVLELTNETTKDIDNIVGSLEVLDNEGSYVTGIALTNWVPGDIYLPNGGSTTTNKNFSTESADKRARIQNEAATYEYRYTTLRIQFAGEDEISYQKSIHQTEQPMVIETTPKKVEPVNRANPEACLDTQITLETKDIYYPGPKCEHIGRTLDSERFMLEFINMCKEAAGITTHLPSIARVQVSSCIHETKRRGLTYRKRLCCDR